MRAEVTFHLTNDEYDHFNDLVAQAGVSVATESIRKTVDFASNELTCTEHLGVLNYKDNQHRYRLRLEKASSGFIADVEIDIENQDDALVNNDNDILSALSGRFAADIELQERRKTARNKAGKSQMALNAGCLLVKMMGLLMFALFILGLCTFVRWLA
jgi:hypothetical protein